MRRDRRRWLAQGAAWCAGASPLLARAAAPLQLAAAWQGADGPAVGLLRLEGDRLRVKHAISVPTRAHAVIQEPAGTLLAVARRPGDWLMRWDRQGAVRALAWIEPNRAYNGHVLCSADGATLYTSETDLDTGAGLVGVREARTLDKRDEWPTQGQDPHMLLWDEHAPPFTRLVVANGGIAIRPETGRMKLDLGRMDSSLVRLDAARGRVAGHWQLEDARLSLRHLAWQGRGAQALLGIALQAEHADAAARHAAPVLARFDGHILQLAASPALAGYGGDIAATREGFIVGCPRAPGLAQWHRDGAWQGLTPLVEACAIALDSSDTPWVGGRPTARRGVRSVIGLPRGIQLDNHWCIARHDGAKEG